MTLYTRGGDRGETSLFDGSRVAKDDLRVSAYGELACDIRAAGATFVDEAAAVDAAIVTGRTWADLPAWTRAFLRLVRERA